MRADGIIRMPFKLVLVALEAFSGAKCYHGISMAIKRLKSICSRFSNKGSQMTNDDPQFKSSRAAYYLTVWRDWMRQRPDELGYPPHSIPFATSGAPRTVDDFCESIDVVAAEAMDAIISDLELHHQIAVHHFNLGAVWRFVRRRPEDVYEEAILAIEKALLRKGLT